MAGELSETLRAFLCENIPTVQAAELLLFFAENRDRGFSAEDVVLALRPRIITVDAVREYAASFTERSLLTETDGRFKYAATQDLDHGVCELLRAYTERPVSLIIAIHHIALGHIESLTDRP
jgi:hypothetical protein